MSPTRQRLKALPLFGDGPSAHRLPAMQEFAGWCEVPPTVAVVGSNGKGSTAQMLAAIFGALGLRVGLTLSPPFRHEEERIQIDGVPLRSNRYDIVLSNALAIADTYRAKHPDDVPGRFEVQSLAARLAFSHADLDVTVVEAGIGGRFDPVRHYRAPVGVLTALDLEHTALLGDRLDAIGYDKLDAFPDGATVFASARVAAPLRRRLDGYARARGMTLRWCQDMTSFERPQLGLNGTRVAGNLEGVPLSPLQLGAVGAHQLDNASSALLAAHAMLPVLGQAMPLAEVVSRAGPALAKLQLPGRFEVCWPAGDAVHPVILDGAHTPRAATALAIALHDVLGDQLPVLLLGLSADKDAEAIAAILAPRAAPVICSQQPTGGLAPERLAAACEAVAPGRVTMIPELDAAVSQARAAAAARQTAMVATGGMHFAAAVARRL